MNTRLRRKGVRSLVWTAAVLLPGAVACSAQPSEGRTPVPDAAALAKARELIREVFEREHSAAKTAAARAALARKMLEQASKTRDEPAGHYCLLRIAGEVAVKAGDARLAVESVDRIVRTYDVEGLRMKADCLGSAGSRGCGQVEFVNLRDENGNTVDLPGITQQEARAG